MFLKPQGDMTIFREGLLDADANIRYITKNKIKINN